MWRVAFLAALPFFGSTGDFFSHTDVLRSRLAALDPSMLAGEEISSRALRERGGRGGPRYGSCLRGRTGSPGWATPRATRPAPSFFPSSEALSPEACGAARLNTEFARKRRDSIASRRLPRPPSLPSGCRFPSARPRRRRRRLDVDDGPVLDLLVVYTPRARRAAGGAEAIASLVGLGVAEANLAFEKSEVEARLRLVELSEVSFAESGRAESDLEILRDERDGALDEVHRAARSPRRGCRAARRRGGGRLRNRLLDGTVRRVVLGVGFFRGGTKLHRQHLRDGARARSQPRLRSRARGPHDERALSPIPSATRISSPAFAPSWPTGRADASRDSRTRACCSEVCPTGSALQDNARSLNELHSSRRALSPKPPRSEGFHRRRRPSRELAHPRSPARSRASSNGVSSWEHRPPRAMSSIAGSSWANFSTSTRPRSRVRASRGSGTAADRCGRSKTFSGHPEFGVAFTAALYCSGRTSRYSKN